MSASIRLVLPVVLTLLVGCATAPEHHPAPARDPAPDVETRIAEAREVPLTREAIPECLAAWREVLGRAREPTHRLEALYGIAMAHSREKRLNPMQAALEEAVLLPVEHPLRTRSFYALAMERHRRGDVAGALANLESFLLSPRVDRNLSAAAGYLRGKWLLEFGHPDRAREALRIFLEENEPAIDQHNRAAIDAARALLRSLAP